MNRWHWGMGVLALALAAGPAAADRTPLTRTKGQREHGTKPDISVPYTTNGNSAFGVYNGVGPRIYSSPNVSDAKNPQSRPVYNLIFYGATKSTGDKSEGAESRPKPKK